MNAVASLHDLEGECVTREGSASVEADPPVRCLRMYESKEVKVWPRCLARVATRMKAVPRCEHACVSRKNNVTIADTDGGHVGSVGAAARPARSGSRGATGMS